MRDGWNDVHTEERVEKIGSSTVLNYWNVEHTDHIKQALIEQISSKLIEKGYVRFTKVKVPEIFGESYRYSAELCVTDTMFSSVFVDNTAFTVNEETFTEEELIDAVKNTYPERLI